MLEIIRHLTGLCGDHYHPSIITLLASGVGFTTIYSYFRCKYFNSNNDR